MMDSLPGIVAFVRTAERHSFVAAARQLGLSASAVGKSVTRLETKLGVRLLQRSTRSLRLTAEGQLFYERCKRVISELEDAEAALAHATAAPRGTLRLSVPTVAYRFLTPHLPLFQKRYPEIRLDIDFNDRMVDIIAEGFDAVIRGGGDTLADSSLSARPVGDFRFMACAAPAYLAAHGIPKRPKDLAHHDCVRFRVATSGLLQPWVFTRSVDVPTSLVMNNVEAVVRAAIRGLGICYLPTFVTAPAVEAGRLQPILQSYVSHGGRFYVVWAAGRRAAPKIKAFVDFVSHGLF